MSPKSLIDIKNALIIGDVHGCLIELIELVDLAKSLVEFDKLIMLGDLINKGPFSFETLQWAKSNADICLTGNHELAFLRYLKGEFHSAAFEEIKVKMGDDLNMWKSWIESWPSFQETPNFICVHAGIAPNLALAKQPLHTLTHIRTWDGKGQDLQNENNPPWYDFYKDSKPIIFGHWAKKGLVLRSNSIGLDTGCVYGKHLSAVHMPSRKLFQVPAKQSYVSL